MYLGKTRLGYMGRNYYRHTLSDSGGTLTEKFKHRFWVGSLILMILVGVSVVLLLGYLAALFSPIFSLENVEFKGNRRVSQKELLRKGGLDKGVNLLSLRLSRVKENMESSPWVKEVQLRRELPNKLIVTVTEHQPLFLTMVGENLYFLNKEGVLFKKVEWPEAGSLPLLTGLGPHDGIAEGRLRPSLMSEILNLVELLSRGKDPFFPHKLSEVHYDPDCGFSLFTMERGIRITLGKDDLPLKVKRLEKIWAVLEKRPDVLALKGISLQYGRRIIVHGLRSVSTPKKVG